jgi:hypothetical protein
LVGAGERQEGICASSLDVAVEGKAERSII